MELIWNIDDSKMSWTWNWTELCGSQDSIYPFEGETHNIGVCFQQLCLQIPILAMMAITSAYYCGRWNQHWIRERSAMRAINFRILITVCLAVLPILRANIILSTTSTLPSVNLTSDTSMLNSSNIFIRKRSILEQVGDSGDNSSLVQQVTVLPNKNTSLSEEEMYFFLKMHHILKRNIYESNYGINILPLHNESITLKATATNNINYQKGYTRLENKATSAKPIDYFVAGTEGLAWFIHLCFLLRMRKGGGVSPRGPMLVRVLLFLLTGISALLLRSHIIEKPQNDVLPNLSLGFSITVVSFLVLYIISLIPGEIATEQSRRSSRYREIGERTALLNSPVSSYVRFVEEQDPSYLGVAMEDVTFLSKLLFYWVTPLVEKGAKGLLNHTDDLYDLPDHISTPAISQEIDKQLHDMPMQEESRTPINNDGTPSTIIITSTNRISLLRLLHKCFGWQYYSVGLLKFIADCISFTNPILFNKFIGFIEDKNEPVSHGYIYMSLLFLTVLLGAFFCAHFTFCISIVGLKIRASIITLVYRKTLQLSRTKLYHSFTFGELMNFISTDTDRIVNSCLSFHTFWCIPLQLVVLLYLLYNQIGLAFLAGLSFAIILIPINKFIANKIGILSSKLMKYKDERVKLIGETLRGITTIKLNVWEERFMRSILKFRESELKYLRGRKYLDALCVYFWATTPILISILTFSTYVMMGNRLDAKTVFTTMALLNMLIRPLNDFPWVLNGLTEAWVSMKRIQRLLSLPDLDTTSYYSTPPNNMDITLINATLNVNGVDLKENDKHKLGISESKDLSSPSSTSDGRKNVTFENEEVFILRNINLNVQKGQLVGVIGKVGSGKSLLLDTILAEIVKERGHVAVRDIHEGFGYVSQNPWIQRGTIRDNILFGKAYERTKYETVLKACALQDDLKSFRKKDLTGVSEAGTTLSGGQKTRIALARAVYADKDIYLLDDIFATLDTNVGRYIFQNVILGLLKHKTRILCTHQTQHLIYADLVIEMSRGRIISQGSPSEILPDLEDYLLSSVSLPQNDELLSIREIKNSTNEQDDNDQDSLLNAELMEKGSLKVGVYMTYIKAIGKYLVISIFLSLILMQSSKNITDLWLSYWATHINDTVLPKAISWKYLDEKNDNTKSYLTVYAILALVNSVFTLIRAFLFAYGGLQAAITMHKQLLKAVLRGKTLFFDSQPFGRILNRFSSDTYTVDDTLPFMLNILCAQFFALVGIIIITMYSVPWTILFLVSIMPFYNWVQNQYRLTSRELKRLSSVTLSPLYSHFNETLQGITSIRAFRVVTRFEHENDLNLEANQKTQFASVAASQWLALRLQLIGALLLGVVCFAGILQHQYDRSDAGLIGLTITYILSMSGLLSDIVNTFTECEREMVAIERIKEYLEDLPTENLSGDNPPYAWPSQGVIEFKNVVLKYRDHLPPSLKGISFVTRPAEKIGIVGRTGAGKSSILSSLFRLTEITSGEILIDNVNVQTLQLDALRSRLSIIPQNPFLFSGTVRENVDPLNQYPDGQIYKALEKCKLQSLVSRLGGLGAVLDEDGSNLSKGQRQLFCLVRAVLHNARILCIDEATANIDLETDRAIQTTIKSSFRSATVVVVAHRIRTIMHCDRVLVMGDGEILEFDEPNLLIQNTDSHFYYLASQEFSDHE